MSFDLSEYVDVAERVREFYARYPMGSLTGEGEFVRDEQGRIIGYIYKARAFRTLEDPVPAVGTAFEPIPGKTPYTKDSEVQNAETSAWGRAIVACGFETKKIASADEVRNRSGAEPDTADGAAPGNPAEDAYQAAVAAGRLDGALPSDQVIHFGKNKGVKLGDLTPAQLRWYATEWKLQDDPSEYDHRIKRAAVALNAGHNNPNFDDEVPFE